MTIGRLMQSFASSKMVRPLRQQRSRARCWALLLACLFLVLPVQSQTAYTPSDVEAAYLYNFGRFIHWPADAAGTVPASFAICILGDDPFGGKLDALIANESIQSRPILIRRISAASAATGCQIVYIGTSEQARLSKDIADLQKAQTLTVSSLPHFLEHGGMIQFLLQGNNVRFSVNLSSAGQAGLELSSELLKVAVQVYSKPMQEEKP